MLLLLVDFDIAPQVIPVATVWTTHVCEGARMTWEDWSPYQWNEII